MPAVSAVIITHNEEQNITRCVQSAWQVADEVVVVDAMSNDATAGLARQLGARVIQRSWAGYSKAKNAGNREAAHDLILSLDADEELSDELVRSIHSAKAQGLNARFRRLTRFGGKWIRHGAWYPDIKTRLFNRDDFEWQGEVHETLVNKSGKPVSLLPGHLLHYSYTSAGDLFRRQEHYAALAAAELHAAHARAGLLPLYLRPAFRFLRDYVFRAGFLDGRPGLTIAVATARGVYLKFAQLRKLNRLG